MRIPLQLVLLTAAVAITATPEVIRICPVEKNPRADHDIFLVEAPKNVARFVDITGETVLESSVIDGDFFEGFARARKDNLTGFVSRQRVWVIGPRFEAVRDFSEGLAAVKIESKWGYAGRDGDVVIPPRFDEAREFYNGRAAVRIGKTFGYIDTTGELVIPARFGVARDFHDNRAWVVLGTRPCWSRSEHFDLYDFGRTLPQFMADQPPDFRLLIPNCRYSLIKRNGELATQIEFDDAHDFSEGLGAAAFFGNGVTTWGFVDDSGEFEIGPQFDRAFSFSEGLATVAETDGLFGFIDREGKFVIAPQFAGASRFSDGLAAVYVQNGRKRRHYYIDRTGGDAFGRSFAYNTQFVHGLAGASEDIGTEIWINTSGQEIYQFKAR